MQFPLLKVLSGARRPGTVLLFSILTSLVLATGSSAQAAPAWTDVQRESIYIPTRDDTLLAADIFRPVRDGEVATGQLPVIWTLQRYHRAYPRQGRTVTIIESRYPWLREVVLSGYIAVIVDARGTGASQGVRVAELGELDARDAYDVTEWLAAREWSREEIGMYGRSFRGMTQYLAAGMNPPHLRAIFPEMAMFDPFDTAYRQGVPLRMFSSWGQVIRRLDGLRGLPPDEDPEGRMLEGWMERRAAENMDVAGFADRVNRRDMVDSVTGIGWDDVAPSRFAPSIREGDVAVHHLVGWLDTWVDDAIAWFLALDGAQQKLTIGPWSHSGRDGFDFAAEHLRWYEHWLVGVDNGVMDEPPIQYATSDLAGRVDWSTTESWPPSDIDLSTFHLTGDAATGAGELRTRPLREARVTARAADYAATTGQTSRWANSTGRSFAYDDMSVNDARGFVWQTAPLEERTVITGQAEASLWVSSSAPDADLFVYLEEVDAQGVSHYVTEGMARASDRSTREDPETARLDQQRVEVRVRLMNTSWAFTPGHRIRLSVTLADTDNARGLTYDPPPEVRFHAGPDTPSRLTLPLETGQRSAAPSPSS
ncbi:MAG: CocE/NonD family hydrolase [Thermoanaerobaculia bacterium]|nr:CocE/NonD family hydrolase [Thermoanaerobaculia bacterium]